MQQYTDEELVAKYKESHDHQYLTNLFTRHSGLLYRSAFRTMKNSSDAEDVLQTVYIKMIADLPNYKGTGSVIGWMLQVVIHTCYERFRSEKSRLKRERKVMSERNQTVSPKNYELNEMIESHLNKLPEIYKAPITLKIMEGLSIKEVSDALEIPEKTIRSQIDRGLEKLKASLQSVGITATVISIGDMIQAIQKPMPPEIFTNSQYLASLHQKKSIISAKTHTHLVAKSSLFNYLITFSFLLATVASVIFSWKYITIAPLLNAKTTIQQKWNFDKIQDFQDFKIIKGSFFNGKSLGLNQSNCLGIEANSVLEIDISNFKLPLKIKYSFDFVIPGGASGKKSSSGYAVLKGNYQKDRNILDFVKFRQTRTIKIPEKNKNENTKLGFVGEWATNTIYVSDDCLDFYFNGNRTSIKLGKSNDNQKLYFVFMDKYLIDNFSVETIETAEVPDISEFKKFSANFPFEKGSRGYFALEKGAPPLNLDKNSLVELAVFDSESVEFNLGLKQNLKTKITLQDSSEPTKSH